MNNIVNDPMWQHFHPLWTDLENVGGNEILVAGGYGLFLKQQWILENAALPIVVPMSQWQNTSPRATKDVDFVVGLDLIGTKEANEGILSVLNKNGFYVTNKPSGKCWTFKKQVSNDRDMIVELHATRPEENHPRLKADDMRVKPKPSMKVHGVHGRTNSEAAGSNLHPFKFVFQETQISVVNPVTWSVMKLTAMRDRWDRSRDANETEKNRSFFLEQAIKHARDVCRVIAMVTADERDSTVEVCDSLRKQSMFIQACTIWQEYFELENGLAISSVSDDWLPTDFLVIQSVADNWFPKNTGA